MFGIMFFCAICPSTSVDHLKKQQLKEWLDSLTPKERAAYWDRKKKIAQTEKAAKKMTDLCYKIRFQWFKEGKDIWGGDPRYTIWTAYWLAHDQTGYWDVLKATKDIPECQFMPVGRAFDVIPKPEKPKRPSWA
jgi:hypothetical protein